MSHKKEPTSREEKMRDDPFDTAFWNERWKKGETGWDMGHASPPITAYMEQYSNKDAAILIPGCGNAYEAAWLADQGFTNITVMDIAPVAVEKLKEKFADMPRIKILCEDFYRHQGKYDLLLEQTFFCAHPPQRRKEYAWTAASILNDKGKLVGILFSKIFERPGPPFGGTVSEYRSIFEPWFDIETMEACYNSIPSRAGSEVFIEFAKK